MSAEARAALERARARLDRVALYPRPVRIERVRILPAPLLFRLPWIRRFDGYALVRTILLRKPSDDASDDLLCHELCHIWQMQNRPFRVVLSYLATGYKRNPYEAEARWAVEATRDDASRRS